MQAAPHRFTDALSAAALIQSAYDAYRALTDTSVLTPAIALPAGETLVAWITMDDFVLVPGKAGVRRFYGFIARDESGGYDVAFRGTEGLLEWWDEFHVVMVPFKAFAHFGTVSEGFERIYQTLDVVAVDAQGRSFAAHDVDPSVAPDAPFAMKAAAMMRRDRAALPRPATAEAVPARVTGHSLGAALATLFVAENAATGAMPVRALHTFASPRVGNRTFAAAFSALEYKGAPLETLRVYNRPDLVPMVPFEFEGFEHVGTPLVLESRASDAIAWTIPCFHALTSHQVCLGAAVPAGWSCDVSKLGGVLAYARRLARKILGIVPARTILTEP
jgi:hypothetical protein